MRFRFISFFRPIRSVGMMREWYAVKADRATWDDPAYPLPPKMDVPDRTLFGGSWEDISPSYCRFDRYSRSRKTVIESKQKLKRLNKRRQARLYRAYQKRTGQF